MKRSQLFLLMVLALQQPHSTANEIACLDQDVIDTLVANVNEQPVTITRGVPLDFPSHVVPEEFKLIGNKRSTEVTVVAYKTDQEDWAAKEGLESKMVESGWSVIPAGTRRFSGGFRNPIDVRGVSSFCKDDYGLIYTQYASAPDSITYVTLNFRKGSGRGTPCGLMISPDRFVMARMDSLPVLDAPEDASGMGGGGTSSDGDSASARIQLETKLSAKELVSHFGKQLVEQGWKEDAQWVGQSSSGSTWTDDESVGFLRVIPEEENRFSVEFEAVFGN